MLYNYLTLKLFGMKYVIIKNAKSNEKATEFDKELCCSYVVLSIPLWNIALKQLPSTKPPAHFPQTSKEYKEKLLN